MDSRINVPLEPNPLRPYSISPQFDSNYSSSTSSPPSLRGSSSSSPFISSDQLPSAGTLLKAFLSSSILSFTGVALVQPFEVGKTLAQVQWVPRTNLELPFTPEEDDDASNEEAVVENESDAEAYFQDLSSTPSFAPPPNSSLLSVPQSQRGGTTTTTVDPQGYISGGVVRPEWVMPIVVQGGVWDMIKAVGKWNGEGWTSLWKGQVATFIYDTISTTLQPTLLSFLTILFLPSSSFSSLPLIYSPKPYPLLILTTLSHTLSTYFLSPLDLVRTRLIVQSSQPSHRKYLSTWSCLRTISIEEGGFSSLYTHANLVWPTLLEGLVKPLLQLSTPLIIINQFKIEPSTSPVLFSLIEFILSSSSLLITIPLETIKKRLQIQSRAEFVRGGRAGGVGRPWRTTVEVRPMPYRGMVECLWRILTEETGKIPRRRRSPLTRRRSSAAPGQTPDLGSASMKDGMSFSEEEEVKEDLSLMGLGASGGLRQLYRGLGMGLGANFVVFLLGLVAGGNGGTMGGGVGGGSGWAEM